jgi:hypothetical protein
MISVETENNEAVLKVDGKFVLYEDDQVVQLTALPNPDIQNSVLCFLRLMDEPAFRYEKGIIGGNIVGEVYALEDPAFWFRALPITFHGTYFFARLPKTVPDPQYELPFGTCGVEDFAFHPVGWKPYVTED